jgi:tetratricopeptide (TPR) repeat protein
MNSDAGATSSEGIVTETAAELVARAARLEKQGLDDQALRLIRLALQQPGLDNRTRQVAGEVSHLCGDLETAEQCWRRLCEIEPWEPRWPFRLATVAEERADYRSACAILASARERWPNHPLVELLRVRFGTLDETAKLTAAEASTLAANPRGNPYVALNAARKLLSMGLTDVARTTLLRLSKLADDTEVAQAAKVELRSMEILEQADPALLSKVPGELGVGNEAVFHRAEGSDTTLVVFSGLGGRVGPSVNVFHAIVAPLRVNAVYLYDAERLSHLNGNGPLGRGYVAAIEALRRMLTAWQSRRLVCIGNSGGGYAALRYGMDLGAERVLGFSAPTILVEDFHMTYDRRARAVVKRVNRHVPDMTVDLRGLLQKAAAPPRVDLYFGSDMPQDRMHAERLSGLPGVTLHPVEGVARHDVAGALLLEGRLLPILRDVCMSKVAS